jgi:hypothetical protein
MKIYLSLAITLLLIIPQFSCKKEEQKEILKLTVQCAVGDVIIKSEGSERVPVVGEEIKQGERIITSRKSIIDIQYGTKGVLRINENSSVEVALLLTSDGAEHSKLNMSEGKIFVTISKLTKNSNFEVSTNTTVAAIRGTSFRVTAGKKESKIDVLSGKIKVNPVKDGQVVEKIEKIVETNNTVLLDDKSVDEVVEGKKEIEVVQLKTEDAEEIREEVKDIKVSEQMKQEVKEEIKEVILEEKIDEEAEKERLEKEKREKEEREALERKKISERERIKRERLEKERAARERLEQERAEKERLERARLEKERLERERAERERIAKEKKERETKEQRVKNIPNL